MALIKKELGEFLVENGIITSRQLDEARLKQKKTGEQLGKILVTEGIVTEKEIIQALENKLGLRRVELYDYRPPTETLKLIPEKWLRRHKVLPLSVEGGTLQVATSDPLDQNTLNDLRLLTGLEIKPFVSTEEEIENVLEEVFGLKELSDIASEAEDEFTTEEKNETEEEEAEKAPIVRAVNSILVQALKRRASDVHLEPEEESLRVRFRIDGVLTEVMRLPRNLRAPVISRIKIMGGMNIAERRLPQDGHFSLKIEGREVDVRLSTMPTIFGEKAVMRLLDKEHKELKLLELGFEDNVYKSLKDLLKRPFGMIIVSGPTGSGKTTTLYSILEEIKSSALNIVTIEDPVEYVLDGINQIQVNPKIGLNFAAGLRSVLRQDPDVIMVGEIRDEETADIAIRAALTGHLVFSTIHTTDAVSGIIRLLDMGIPGYLISASVTAVLSQRLVRKICPRCKEKIEINAGDPIRFLLGAEHSSSLTLYRGKGCTFCEGTGYLGRVVLGELFVLGKEERELILKGVSQEELVRRARKKGMMSLREDGIQKILKGITTVEEVQRVTFFEDEV